MHETPRAVGLPTHAPDHAAAGLSAGLSETSEVKVRLDRRLVAKMHGHRLLKGEGISEMVSKAICQYLGLPLDEFSTLDGRSRGRPRRGPR